MLSTWEERFQRFSNRVSKLELDATRDRATCVTGERLQDNVNARVAARLKDLEARIAQLEG